LGATLPLMPHLPAGTPSFFSSPESFPTGDLARWFYVIPIHVYLLLWTYNELAVGLSLWVGIRVDDNFKWLPGATSVRDFWRRWHVTVGAWLRDCVYIPLGGNRGQVWLHYVAVFAYMGVWHGPSWSFLAWGLLQALALSVQRQWDRVRERWGWAGRPAGRVWTFVSWWLTMHYAVATIVIFTDFDHRGVRLLLELVRRMAGGAAS
jgi:D-alanyl-lipoteichoic acid acyltransferase DltB (MBOAT superfamily)